MRDEYVAIRAANGIHVWRSASAVRYGAAAQPVRVTLPDTREPGEARVRSEQHIMKTQLERRGSMQ